MAHHHHNENIHEVEHEPLPARVYVGVLLGLAFLTFVTVWVAQYDFGSLNVPIALAIATMKASLVILYFMNLKYERGFNAVAFLAGFIFLVVFALPTLWDRETRDALDRDRNVIVHHTRPGFPPQVTGEKPADKAEKKEGESVATH